jgi:hypothetical protein
MKVAWNATNQKKRKVGDEKLNLYNTILLQKLLLWGCVLWREDVDDNTQHNATTRHHEEDVENEMQYKNQEFKFVNEQGAKRLKTNKHRV